MRAREGDMIEAGGAIFDVKGLLHPPSKVVASLHFLSDLGGNRTKGSLSYRKIFQLSERQRLLKEKFPGYLVLDPVFGGEMCEVPAKDIERYYGPANRLQELRREGGSDHVEKLAVSFVELIKDASNITWRNLGISGSILAGLHTQRSDIDPVVYGSKNCRKVYEALKAMLQSREGPAKRYDAKGLRRLYASRSKDTIMSYGNFVRTESRKVLQGVISGRDYSIKLIKDWDEIADEYGSVRYSNAGYARIKARIADDSEAIFTPSCYHIENVELLDGQTAGPIEEIVSFRMRFCEQARKGEEIIAKGKVERVQKRRGEESFRLVVGSKKSDSIILAK